MLQDIITELTGLSKSNAAIGSISLEVFKDGTYEITANLENGTSKEFEDSMQFLEFLDTL